MTMVSLISSLLLSLCLASSNPYQDQSSNAPPAKPVQDQDDLLRDPINVLDERINRDKITEQDLPRLPESVILPMPPDHRIAPRPGDVPIDAERWAKAHAAIGAGLGFLRASQHDMGAWMMGAEAAPTDEPAQISPVSVAVTALAVKCFAQFGINLETDRNLQNAVAFVINAQHDDGRFEGGALSNYVTSAAVSALASIDDRSLEEQLVRATRWLQHEQWDQSEGLSPRQDWFGGAGYGNSGRPDLSNTQMMLDALYDAGLSPDEPSFQRALVFLSRAQNLEATNPADWASSNDGGFIYTPANGGESMASEAAGEGRFGENSGGAAGEARSLRSYGSMTYAGFKSMLYAGLSPDDVRVRAAFDWIRNHWTFDENPGVGQQGLYYYYHTMARALRASQQETIADIDGVEHNWRAELIDAIIARQRPDGSWVNDADRWMEGSPDLVTIYCLLALEEALK